MKKGREIYERKKSLDSIKVLLAKSPSKGISELLYHLEQYPDDMYAYLEYAKFHEEHFNLEEAEYAYEKIANSKSWNRYAGVVGLGSVAEQRGDLATAKKYYRKALSENPNEKLTTSYALACLERTEGNYEEALKILNSIKNPTAQTQVEKLKIYNAAGNIEETLKLSERIIPENERQARSIALSKAIALTAKKDILSAKIYFMQAKDTLTRDKIYYKTLYEEAIMLLENTEYQAALDNCEEILQNGYTFFGNTNYIKGQAEGFLGKYKEALDSYQKALKEKNLSPATSEIIYYSLGRLQLSMGDLASAENSLKSSVANGIKCRHTLSNLVIVLILSIYIRERRLEEAKTLISKVKSEYSQDIDSADLDFASVIVAKLQNEPVIVSPQATYRIRQVANYSKKKAIRHIQINHTEGELNSSNFFAGVDIAKLMEEVKPYLIEDNRVSEDLLDKYNIDYPNIGYSPDGAVINRIGVVVIPGTSNILTMYPANDSTSVRQRDILDQIGKATSIAENKSISKFNARFAKFKSINNS